MAENMEMNWYVIHTYSGYENKVMTNLLQMMDAGMKGTLTDVQIPMEKVVEIRNGKRHEYERKRMPGYVLVRMYGGPDNWTKVRNIHGVTGFLGPDSKSPTVLTQAEYEAMFAPAEDIVQTEINVGDEVRILTGLFENFMGTVTEIDADNNRVKVSVKMLKHETEIDLAFDEIIRGELNADN